VTDDDIRIGATFIGAIFTAMCVIVFLSQYPHPAEPILAGYMASQRFR
jgi:hypothetical protein